MRVWPWDYDLAHYGVTTRGIRATVNVSTDLDDRLCEADGATPGASWQLMIRQCLNQRSSLI